MKLPKVLISILSYNHEKFVDQCILSAINQTYENIQIVVSDNASTDNSRIIIQKIAHEFPQIEVYLHKSNLGVCKAGNFVMMNSDAEWFIDLAADDLLHPDFISKMISSVKSVNVKVLISNYYVIDKNGLILNEYLIPKKYKTIDLQEDSFWNTSKIAHLINLNSFKEIGGYDENLKFEDMDIHVRMSERFEYQIVREALFGYRYLKNSLSKSYENMFFFMDSFEQILPSLRLVLKENKYDSYIYKTAFRYYSLEKFESAFRLLNQMDSNNFKVILLKILTKLKIKNYRIIHYIWIKKFDFTYFIYRLKNGSRNINDLFGKH